MVVLRSSATGAGTGTDLEDRVGMENKLKLKPNAHNHTGTDMAGSNGTGVLVTDAAPTMASVTIAEQKLLERAELMAAEFDVSTEQLDACVAEFVREMGVFPFIFSVFTIP